MSPAAELAREELAFRRERLAALIGARRPATTGAEDQLVGLLRRVDSALERLDTGGWGRCEVCHAPIEGERLRADPLVTVCLACLTPDQRQALERDLETASRVQATLLPPRRLERDGWETAFLYEPLGPVSGDYCDLVAPGGDGPLQLLFGDVAGKGVAASLLQSNLRALFRALAELDLPLAELLERVNRLFCEATGPSAYATLVAARLDRDGSVELAGAGHPAPLLWRGGEVAAIEARGLPVGLFGDARFATRRLTLGAGETLLLYTDGWTEASRHDGEEYSVARAAAVLSRAGGQPLAELLAACRNDVESFLAGAPRSDDLTLMAVRRRR